MKIKAYIFDFDGTLVDSMPCWSRKMINILDGCGAKYPPDIIKTIATLGDKGAAQYFKDVLKVELSMEEMFRQMDEYALPRYRDEIILKEGVFDYLVSLKRKGCSLNILTASPHKMLDPCLKRCGIFDMFDNVWSTDDFGMTKVDTAIYNEAARRLGVAVENAAFFDDNIGAVKTAAAAGMYTVGVYDESGDGFWDEMKSVSDVYTDTFSGFCLV